MRVTDPQAGSAYKDYEGTMVTLYQMTVAGRRGVPLLTVGR
jgi:hypothetical protein